MTITQAVRSTAADEKAPKRAGRLRTESKRAASTYYWMVWPAVIAFAAFHTLPVVVGIFFSFTNYAGYGAWNFVGLSNYFNLFQDDRVLQAYGFSFLFAIVATILTNAFSLAIALGLNAKIKARNFWRGVYFVPYILAILVIGYVFQFLFSNSLPKILSGIPLFADNILAQRAVGVDRDRGARRMAGLRVRDHHLPVRPADDPRGNVRGGIVGRRLRMAAIHVDHLPADRCLLHDQRRHQPERVPAGVRSPSSPSPMAARAQRPNR